MEYSNSKPKLILPEYGRNIQTLVAQAVLIENRTERNKYAQGIINLMGDMYPHLRDVPDFKHKLWDHLAIMSNFQLDIDAPYPTPPLEILNEKPKKVNYIHTRIRFKHYGRIIVDFINSAIQMEASTEKENLTLAIANHMKKQYMMWNKDLTDDSIILNDLKELSNNLLSIPNNVKLNDIRDISLQKSSIKKDNDKKGKDKKIAKRK